MNSRDIERLLEHAERLERIQRDLRPIRLAQADVERFQQLQEQIERSEIPEALARINRNYFENQIPSEQLRWIERNQPLLNDIANRLDHLPDRNAISRLPSQSDIERIEALGPNIEAMSRVIESALRQRENLSQSLGPSSASILNNTVLSNFDFEDWSRGLQLLRTDGLSGVLDAANRLLNNPGLSEFASDYSFDDSETDTDLDSDLELQFAYTAVEISDEVATDEFFSILDNLSRSDLEKLTALLSTVLGVGGPCVGLLIAFHDLSFEVQDVMAVIAALYMIITQANKRLQEDREASSESE